jgi:hypothetical protein
MSDSILIKQCQPGWFVLLWDDVYNAQHLGGKLLLKTPIVCFLCDSTGEVPPILYGSGKEPLWNDLHRKAHGIVGADQHLEPLAFDAIVAPDGKLLTPDGNVFNSVPEWMEEMGYPPCSGIEVDIVERPGTKGGPRSAAEVQIPF